jgi:hypothetical protein
VFMNSSALPSQAPPFGWPEPNLINPERQGNALLILICLLGGISTAVTGARLYARIIRVSMLGADDVIMGIGYVSGLFIILKTNELARFAAQSYYHRSGCLSLRR